MDNLNHASRDRLYEAFEPAGRVASRSGWRYITKSHAREHIAHMAEIEIRRDGRQCLDHASRHRSVLRRETAVWQQQRNRDARTDA